jgi:hypothetical protein
MSPVSKQYLFARSTKFSITLEPARAIGSSAAIFFRHVLSGWWDRPWLAVIV